MGAEDDESGLDLDVLHKKGSFPLLMVVASGDKTTTTEMRDLTGLSAGTVQRRRDELIECNCLEQQPKLNDAGNAVIAYYLTEEMASLQSALSELGEKIYR